MLNRWVLSRDRKTATEGVEVTTSGRLFQTWAAVTGKARSPTVDSQVRLTISDEDELERSRRRASTSATWQSSSVRYAGADPWSVQVSVMSSCGGGLFHAKFSVWWKKVVWDFTNESIEWSKIFIINTTVQFASFQCVAPLAANNLQSGLSSASSVASSTLRLCYDRSFFIVANQEVWGRPVGFFQSLWGTAVRILLASADLSILTKWPNSTRRLLSVKYTL